MAIDTKTRIYTPSQNSLVGSECQVYVDAQAIIAQANNSMHRQRSRPCLYLVRYHHQDYTTIHTILLIDTGTDFFGVHSDF